MSFASSTHLWSRLALTGAVLLIATSCSSTGDLAQRPPEPPGFSTTVTQAGNKLTRYQLDTDTQGVIETVNNIVNVSIVSNDPNVYKAEYEAGFIQGKLQGPKIIAARDNSWDNAYLTNPKHSYPQQIPPSPAELALAQQTLTLNLQYTLDYIHRAKDTETGQRMQRLLYRLIGIQHGATRDQPAALTFTADWSPTVSAADQQIGYQTPTLTFMDVYFINAVQDLLDVLPDHPPQAARSRPSKCSAFVKRTPDDILIAHNSWSGFLSQTQAMSLWVNGDFMTFNPIAPGYLGSSSDFGYNNHGLLFNETTHHATYTEPKVEALWMFWRATLAEQFSRSLAEFFKYIALEPSGTYMNGYMVIDAKTGEIGLVEMSYKSFVFYQSNGKGGYTVTSQPKGLDRRYDPTMVAGDYLIGINYPASYQIRRDLKAQDTRPARKRQFLAQIGAVNDLESAKQLITYTAPDNPLSIFGRWDVGYGETPTPKTIPDGSLDAKAGSVTLARRMMSLQGALDANSPVQSFWMKFGTPYIKGAPFIWSQSPWKEWQRRDVPDRLDGDYTLLNAYIR